MNHLLGAHVSIAGGIHHAIERGERSGCAALQIFTKNASRWRAKPVLPAEAKAFISAWRASSIGPVLAHDSYLINLASPKNSVWQKSKKAFLDEMRRSSILGIPAVVIHPGAHLGAGEQQGIHRIRTALKEVLPVSPSEVRILIENTAGQGSSLGYDFTHLAEILDGFDPQRLGVCFDTCHAHAAGYDLSTEQSYKETMVAFQREVGLWRIEAFHLNDCLRECGSRIDRHVHIGQGTIGREGFSCLMRDQRFADRPMLLETPKGDDQNMDRHNLSLLRQLAEGAPL